MEQENLNTPEGSTEKLVQMVNLTAATLNKIWDEVGFNESEREAQIQALIEQVHGLCEEKVVDEEAVRDTFISSIEENKAKSVFSAKRLGEAPPSIEKDEDGVEVASLALTLQLAYFEQLSTKLEIKVYGQESKLNLLHQSLVIICQELELDAENEWQSCGGLNGSSEDLSENAIMKFSNKIDQLNIQKTNRIQQVTDLVIQCQGLLQELGMAPNSSEFDSQIVNSLDTATETPKLLSYLSSNTCVGIGTENLNKLISRQNELVEERDKRSAYLMDLGEKVSKLWELLDISEEEQISFEESLTGGLSEATIKIGDLELSRLENLKKTKMVEIITSRRNEINKLWNETSSTLKQRESFLSYHIKNENLYNDELLEQHDNEVNKLKLRLEAMQPLLKLVIKYEEAVSLRSELEELKKDKDRLKGRGSAKQLQLEEQMSKKIKQLPKIIESLTKQVNEWELAEGIEFTMKTNQQDASDDEGVGRRCLDVINETEDEWSKRKEEAAANKKAAKDVRGSISDDKKSSDLGKKRRPSKVPLGDRNSVN